MATEEFPSVSVQPDGPPRQLVNGTREQDYIDEHRDRWTCVTDSVSRRWFRRDAVAAPVLKLVRSASGA